MVDGEYLWRGVKTTHFTSFVQNIVIISSIAIQTKIIELVLVHLAQPNVRVFRVLVHRRVATALLLLPLKVSTRGKLSGRARSVRVHAGGNRFLVYSRFCIRLPSAALPSLK